MDNVNVDWGVGRAEERQRERLHTCRCGMEPKLAGEEQVKQESRQGARTRPCRVK